MQSLAAGYGGLFLTELLSLSDTHPTPPAQHSLVVAWRVHLLVQQLPIT